MYRKHLVFWTIMFRSIRFPYTVASSHMNAAFRIVSSVAAWQLQVFGPEWFFDTLFGIQYNMCYECIHRHGYKLAFRYVIGVLNFNPLKMKFICYLQIQFLPQRKRYTSITKISHLMLFKKIITGESYKTHKYIQEAKHRVTNY